MRILIVNKFLSTTGGADAYAIHLGGELAARGHDVRFFGMQTAHIDTPEDRSTLISQINFRNPRGLDGVRAAIRSIYSLEARKALASLLHVERFDVAHLNNIYHQLSPSILHPLSRAGVPVVMTVHDYKLVCPSYNLYTQGARCTRCVGGTPLHAVVHKCGHNSLSESVAIASESWIHRRIDIYNRHIRTFISPSRFMARKLVEGGFPPRKVTTIPYFAAPGAGATPTDSSGVFYVGRLAPEKGVEHAVRASAISGIPLTVVGDGPERATLERLRDGMSARVSFVGWRPQAEVRQILRSARALVVPSVWHDNYPVVVLEAMAEGCPIIASAVGGLPEMVDDGVTGFLVPPGDASRLASAIRIVQHDPQLASSLGRAARTQVIRRNGLEGHLASLFETYDAAANGNLAA